MAGTVIALGVVAVAVVATSAGVVGFVVTQLRGSAAGPLADDALGLSGPRAPVGTDSEFAGLEHSDSHHGDLQDGDLQDGDAHESAA